ncbi:methyltransferase domain-containing protein [Saccharopolyspora rosea]|uniref:Methyltransferase domain-containing protein n=1 Tax=Saccharopolyspora rosea TaxID=524884 RepID=A0ABW3G3Y4_9PSEU|nr:methyltransferase domain-containing protein [Saccharopolyspora rosea]
MRAPIEDCYHEWAEVYAAIADDRDFAAQVGALESLCAPPGGPRALLDLFAGPAYHAVEAGRRGWLVSAVDASRSMREVALARGFPDAGRYHVCAVPDDLSATLPAEHFDCALVSRYSAGYLGVGDVERLLRELRDLLRPGGVAVFELHDVSAVAGGLHDLGIQARTATLADGTRIECYWPDGRVVWSADDYVVEMPVRIETDHPTSGRSTSRFASVEHIHSAASVRRLAERAGLSVVDEDLRCAFPESTPVILRKG